MIRNNGEVAYRVLQGDLQSPQWYGLKEDGRDTLIAHTREDAAHALLNSIAILRQGGVIKTLLTINIALLAAILYKVW